MKIEDYLDISPYSLSKKDKKEFLIPQLNKLNKVHYEGSMEYKSILDSYNQNIFNNDDYDSFYPMPVRLFKEFDIKTCKSEEVIKVLTSSGTTSQKVSKIFLNKETSRLQTNALVKIMQTYLGKERLPMLIIDSKSIFKDRKQFSARGAGILGLSNFGRDHTYVLDEHMTLDEGLLKDFLNKHGNKKFLIFGFTFMVREYLYEEAINRKLKIDLSNGILIHSGGWKKLIDKAVTNEVYKSDLNKIFSLKNIHDFYGMVEQVGSIFVECEYSFLHAPIFSDILARDPITHEVLQFGHKGLLQVLSILPRSYPGHSLLTEDIGTIYGEDDCQCGRKGKYFKVHGRLPKSEVRGCSDTHASEVQKSK